MVLYSASGSAWLNPTAITISFVPDGTDLGGVLSNMNSAFNNNPRLAGQWQDQILKAAQVWAQQTNINFILVPDNGGPLGQGDNQEGDPGYGDIRIGGFYFGSSSLARATEPPPMNNCSIAGDVCFNTGMPFNINNTYDLFTVATHEIGHALGLNHSDKAQASMFPNYNSIKPNLYADDITGIRNIYSSNAPRSADAYDALGLGNSFAMAPDLSTQVDPVTLTDLVNNLDLTTTSDVDYYTFTAPQGTNSTFTVNVQSSGLSLLSPKVTVYAADQTTVVGSASGLNQYGTTLSVKVSGATAGSRYYVKVEGDYVVNPYQKIDTSAFGTGKYALALNFGNGATPTAPSAVYAIPNGNPFSAGGGIADSPGDFDDFVDGTPIVTGISNDRGASTNDGVTNDPTLFVTGRAPEGSTVQVYRNGQFIGTTVTGRAATTASGLATSPTSWWFDDTGTTLPDGTYFYTARVIYPDGTVSAMSDSYTVVIDTQAPAAPTIVGINLDTEAGHGNSRVSTAMLTGTAAAHSQVTLSRDGHVVGSTFADSNGVWSWSDPRAGAPNGTVFYTATATDLAGNTSGASKVFKLQPGRQAALATAPWLTNNTLADLPGEGPANAPDMPILVGLATPGSVGDILRRHRHPG